MAGRYNKPPVIEAVCEFKFQADTWDWTIPGLLYREIESEFSVKREKLLVQMEQSGDEVQEFKAVQARRLHFVRPDETAFVDLGENVLAIHQLPPYQGWHRLKPLIDSTFERYLGVAKPKGLTRIGLRYVNQLNLSEPTIDLPNYLTFGPRIPQGLPTAMKAMFCRVELLYPNDGLLLLSVGSIKGGIVLDLDFVTLDASVVSLSDASAWVEMAHRNVGAAFEAAIRDPTRDLFGRRDLSEAQR